MPITIDHELFEYLATTPVLIHYDIDADVLRNFDPTFPETTCWQVSSPEFDSHMVQLINTVAEAIFGRDFASSGPWSATNKTPDIDPNAYIPWSSVFGNDKWAGVSVTYPHNVPASELEPELLSFYVSNGLNVGDLVFTRRFLSHRDQIAILGRRERSLAAFEERLRTSQFN